MTSFKIKDMRNEKGSTEIAARKEAERLIEETVLLSCGDMTPGAFINRYKNRYKFLDKMKAEHFQ